MTASSVATEASDEAFAPLRKRRRFSGDHIADLRTMTDSWFFRKRGARGRARAASPWALQAPDRRG
eukprot:5803443-Pyramimonas_sp.AAC.1